MSADPPYGPPAYPPHATSTPITEYERAGAAALPDGESEYREESGGGTDERDEPGTIPSPLYESPPLPNEHQAASPPGPADRTPTAPAPRGQGAIGHETQPLEPVATFDGLAVTQSDADWLQRVTMSDDSTPPTPSPPQGARARRTEDGAKNRKRARTSYSPDEHTPGQTSMADTAPPPRGRTLNNARATPAPSNQQTYPHALSAAGTVTIAQISMGPTR